MSAKKTDKKTPNQKVIATMNISRSDLKIIRSGKPFSIGLIPSQLMAGRNVVVVAKVNDTNKKTGLMIQIAFMDPEVDQRKIDGDIPNGQGCFRSACSIFDQCYVQSFVFHIGALARVIDHYNAGILPSINLGTFLAYVGSCGIPVRFGEYGDPSSVPFEYLETIASKSSGWTGYTHGWKNCDQRLKTLCMASVENESDYRLAKSMGWNVFWVNGTPDKTEFRMTCLNVTNDIQCADCKLCRGDRYRFDIVIPAHGRNAKKVGV